MCRKKKIKCDGGMPACKNCINYKTECIFTQVEKKRNPPKGYVAYSAHSDSHIDIHCSAKYIEGLENRLGRMESLLKLSGLLNEEDGDRTDLGTLEKRLQGQGNQSNGGTPDRSSKSGSQPRALGSTQSTPQMDRMPTPKSSKASPEPPKEKEAEVEELSDMMCSLVTNNCGETRYIGRSGSYGLTAR